jgi:hypothetical protein
MTLPNRCSCRSGIWNLARPVLSRWRTAEWTCCVTTVEPYPVSTMAGEKSGDPACAVFPRFETSDDIHMMSPTHVSHPPASSFKKQVIGHVTRHGRQLWKCFANWIPLPWRINVDPPLLSFNMSIKYISEVVSCFFPVIGAAAGAS